MRLLGVLATRGEDAYARGDKGLYGPIEGWKPSVCFVWLQKMLLQ